MMASKAFAQKNILVTGGGGFIGSHLVDSLVNDEAKVAVLDIKNEEEAQIYLRGVWEEIDYYQGDVQDRQKLQPLTNGKDYVFHLAANASVPNSVKKPIYDFKHNVEGTLTLLESIRATDNLAKIIFASSAATYGEGKYDPVDESHPQEPISPYGASKLSGEKYGLVYQGVYGVNFTAARIFNTYGPRQPRYIMFDFLEKLSQDPTRLEILGNGQQMRDYCYVADTVRALKLLAVKKETRGDFYNIASGCTASATDIGKLIIELLELEDVKIEYTGKSWKGDVQHWTADPTKINQLGFQSEYSLREGLQELIAWYQHEYKGKA